MRNGFFPVFTKGRVLKKESIEYLRDFPYDLASLACDNYSDGILSGFSISSSGDGHIHISKGSLKYQEDIIVVPDKTIMMVESEYGEFLYTKIAIGKSSETEDFIIRPIELKIDTHAVSAENEIELGRFCLHRGAELRCTYTSFDDLRTVNDTMDLTHIPYAGYEAPTLHPRVMKEYAKEILKASHEPADIAFALMCLNTGVVHKTSIQWHIASKKPERTYVDFAFPELYDKLLELLPHHGITGIKGPRRTAIR
jgi:hypothetical protein